MKTASRNTNSPSFWNVVRSQAERRPDATVFSYLNERGDLAGEITYQQLEERAKAIGTLLQQNGTPGERVLLLLPTGLEFITSFLGCLAAGNIAVPVPAPDNSRLKRTAPRLNAVAVDATPTVVLANASFTDSREQICAYAPSLRSAKWVCIDDLPIELAADWRDPNRSEDSVAYLQYTSGSTSVPKGVAVSHSNIVAQAQLIEAASLCGSDSVVATWMPHFHDFGLVFGVLVPIHAGTRALMMSPMAFLKRPIRWLEAISRFRVTHSGGPNFGFEYCNRKIRPEQLESVDLSSWIFAPVGAEPVRSATLQRFQELFGPAGFRPETFRPGYGLAEATLVVSLSGTSKRWFDLKLDPNALEKHEAVEVSNAHLRHRSLVACGQVSPDNVCIVDPQTKAICPNDRIGEIWCSSPSVTLGYWGRPEESERTFQAYIAGSARGPFLRTGDLGFVRNGDLFVTGRLKDLLIFAGVNHYPQDIEWTVEESHPAIKSNSTAAFSVDGDNQESLVVVTEANPQEKDHKEIFAAIRRAVAEVHDLDIDSICLLRPGGILKTSSGKIQRRACRTAFLEGNLDVLARDPDGRKDPLQAQQTLTTSTRHLPKLSLTQVVELICSRLAALSSLAPDDIDIHAPMAQYGLTSREGLSLLADLEDKLCLELAPAVLFQNPSVDALSNYLVGDREQRRQLSSKEPASSNPRPVDTDPIAIIGLGCRFPGADNPEAFWQMLCNGVDAVTEVPGHRWDVRSMYTTDAGVPGKMTTRWGGFLEGVDQFDPQFFGISPREAAFMDPQQRLLLEVAWQALENACQSPRRLAGSNSGVFIGICTSDYASLLLKDRNAIGVHTETGSAGSIAANRLSYIFDFRGPSMAIDTACSSSLVAVHLACESLRSGQSNLALAGGVNLVLIPEWTIAASQARMMSTDGRCRAFDAGANGYVRGEGCGVVVLKRLSDAVKDGDPVLAVLRSTALNQDGRSNGLTAPNPNAQQEVICEALRLGRVRGDEIDYVEAHGSGTPLGDPIEFESIANIIGRTRSATDPCWIGSVKSNIGHLEAAAGVAGLIKVVLALNHGEIPPHLHLKKINPYIHIQDSGLDIVTERRAWPRRETPRLAGINSFGFGGTNAHAVIQEAPTLERPVSAGRRPIQILCLSGKSKAGLQDLAEAYCRHLRGNPSVDFADVCYTASTCRGHFNHRLVIIAGTTEQAIEQIRAFTSGHISSGVYLGVCRGNQQQTIGFRVDADVPSGSFDRLVEVGPATKWNALLEGLAQAYVDGADIDWEGFDFGHGRRKVLLPNYPFQRQRCWIETKVQENQPEPFPRSRDSHPLAGSRLYVPGLKEAVFQSFVGANFPEYLLEHRVYGNLVMPATAFFEMALAAGQRVFPAGVVLENISVLDVLKLEGTQESKTVQTIFTIEDTLTNAFKIVSLVDETGGDISWKVHATGQVRLPHSETNGGPQLDVGEIRARCREALPVDDLYQTLKQFGLEYGPTFKHLTQIWRRKGEALGSLKLQASFTEESSRYVIHPGILDTCLHLLAAAIPNDGIDEAYIPVKVQRLQVFGPVTQHMWCRAISRTDAQNRTSVTADFLLIDQSGAPIVEMKGMTFSRVSHEKLFGRTARDFRDWLYRIEWQTQESEYVESQIEPAAWIVFADRSDVAESMFQQLEDAEQHCYLVVPGENFAFNGRKITLNPANAEHFDRLFTECKTVEPLPFRAIVHMWGLTQSDIENTPALCGGILHLVQAVRRRFSSMPPRVCFVTRATQFAASSPVYSPGPATVMGFNNVITAEHPELRSVVVDLPTQVDPGLEARFIIEEVLGPAQENRVALRGKLRYVPRLARIRLGTTSLVQNFSLSTQSTYCVTGGLGAVGLTVARWLVERGARHVALIGRGAASEIAREAVQQLQSTGAEIAIINVDVSDLAAVGRAVEQITKSMPPLRGVFHAAGVLDDTLIAGLDRNRFAAVMAPKVMGGWNLHQVTRDCPLDYFVLFSSAAALLPNAGQASYAAANACLDSLAAYRRSEGLPGLTVNWGFWNFAGIGSEMTNLDRERLSRIGIGAIDPTQGLAALEYLLSHGETQAVAFPCDWDKFLSAFGDGREPCLTSAIARERRLRTKNDQLEIARLEMMERLRDRSVAERVEILEAFIHKHVVEILGFESSCQLDPSLGFSEIGMDSVMAVELQHRLQAGLGISIPATALFDQPTTSALARYILDKVLQFAPEEPHPVQAVSKKTVDQVHKRAAAASAAVDVLSEDDIVALLAKELDNIVPASRKTPGRK